MKVVLFCGGQGFQLPGQDEPVPKPMTKIGYRPILWHVMRYYAHCGLKDFVLCLGYRGDVVKHYFLRYNEALTNDFILSGGGLRVELLQTDIDDWTMTFVDTGINTNVAERLLAVKSHLVGETIFCVNYGDTLTDVPLTDLIKDFESRNKVAAVLAVRPNYSFHVVSYEPDGQVTAIDDIRAADQWVNGGYFIFRPAIFDYIRANEDLVDEPFQRLIAAGQLVAYRYDGFWRTLDTLKDLQDLQVLHDGGRPPWAPRAARPVGLQDGGPVT
jgi:glucose-1-phosphate cytidylyltransferase